MAKTELEVAKRLVSTYQSAVTRGLDCDLTFAKMKRLLNTKRCYYTGVEMNDIEGHENQLTIDRIDNDKGYLNDNVVACTKFINQRKGSLSLKEIEIFYNKTILKK